MEIRKQFIIFHYYPSDWKHKPSIRHPSEIIHHKTFIKNIIKYHTIHYTSMKIIHYYPSEISVEISQKVCDHFPWWWVMVFHSDYIMVTNGDIIKYQTLISLLFNHYYLWFNITITHLYIYIIIHILHSKNIPKISLRYHKHIPKILYHQDIMNDIPKISLRYWYWLVVLTILKNTSQWEGWSWLSHTLWKIKNVWNHQPG